MRFDLVDAWDIQLLCMYVSALCANGLQNVVEAEENKIPTSMIDPDLRVTENILLLTGFARTSKELDKEMLFEMSLCRPHVVVERHIRHPGIA